ncbi:hypothetical protein [Microbacterium sp.]|uniref:hypothetical protein n=1 Tax=Microbacterium sp. TaxID=51671 RepID=UPI003C21B624
MTDQSASRERRLSEEAARWRRELRSTQSALADANRMLLGIYLRGRLADPTDFDIYVDADTIIDRTGRIVWARVDALLEELLSSKPYLAAPVTTDPWPRGQSALSWLTTET